MIDKAPLCFAPYLKSVIWGGNKICSYKGIDSSENNVGESWEISAVPGHESVVTNGKYKGRKITELIDSFGPDLLGKDVFEKYNGCFPLLVKIIDANDNLSVQVHPNDTLAMARHNCLGKTEMWYIIDSEKDAKIYSGLKEQIGPCEYVAHVANGTIEDVLAVHDSAPGDVFFLPAGRVHAIGAGNLLAEIQESSDITYRIYDYNRRDAEGNLRQLHTAQAKDAIDYTLCDEYKSAPIPDEVKDAEIVKCSHFNVRRVMVDNEISLDFDSRSFSIIMCISGEAEVVYPDGSMVIKQGQTILCPAVLNNLKLVGKATLLTSQAI